MPLPLATDIENWAESVDGLVDLRKSLTRAGETLCSDWSCPKGVTANLNRSAKFPLAKFELTFLLADCSEGKTVITVEKVSLTL